MQADTSTKHVNISTFYCLLHLYKAIKHKVKITRNHSNHDHQYSCANEVDEKLRRCQSFVDPFELPPLLLSGSAC